jgi:hypothetical protein
MGQFAAYLERGLGMADFTAVGAAEVRGFLTAPSPRGRFLICRSSISDAALCGACTGPLGGSV